jgi:hypothetical protein
MERGKLTAFAPAPASSSPTSDGCGLPVKGCATTQNRCNELVDLFIRQPALHGRLKPQVHPPLTLLPPPPLRPPSMPFFSS